MYVSSPCFDINLTHTTSHICMHKYLIYTHTLLSFKTVYTHSYYAFFDPHRIPCKLVTLTAITTTVHYDVTRPKQTLTFYPIQNLIQHTYSHFYSPTNATPHMHYKTRTTPTLDSTYIWSYTCYNLVYYMLYKQVSSPTFVTQLTHKTCTRTQKIMRYKTA